MTYDDWKADVANREGSAPDDDDAPAEACAGCDTQVHLTADEDGRLWCEECCPQLFCKACLSSTGGSCREHCEEGREPWGPGFF